MTNREKIVQLVGDLMRKTEFNQTRIIATMAKHDVDISAGRFYDFFRNSGRTAHKGNYTQAEIVALIKTFSLGLEASSACTAFEAVLLSAWANTGLEALAQLIDIFIAKELLQAIETFLYIANQNPEFDYFDPETRKEIDKLLHADSILFSQSLGKNDILFKPSYSQQKIFETIESFVQPVIDGKSSLEATKLYVRSGLYQKAEGLIDTELKLAFAKNDFVQVSELQQQAAIIKTNQGDYEYAEKLLKQAYQNAKEAPPELRLIISANLASNFYYRGEYPKAVNNFSRCVEEAEAQAHNQVYIYSLIGLGNACERLSQYEDAYQHYLQALKLAKKLDFPERCAYVSTSLGNISLQLNNYEKASQYFNDAFKYAERANDPLLYAGLFANSSLLLLINGERQQAKIHLDFASELTQKLGIKSLQLHIQVLQAKVKILESQYFEAIGQYIYIIQQAIEMKHFFLLGLGLYGLSLCLLMQQSALRGRTLSLQAKEIKDRLEIHKVQLPNYRIEYLKENLKNIEDEFRLGIVSSINLEFFSIGELVAYVLG